MTGAYLLNIFQKAVLLAGGIVALVLGNIASGIAAEKTEKIHHFTLKNGLEVALIQDYRSPVVVHMVWYKAGSVDEVEGKTGIAHMLEHMMFKGTDDILPGEFSKKIAALGGQDNAFTSYDYTAYYQKIARENLSQAVKLEADRSANLNISDETFQPERDVILEERNTRVDSDPISSFFEKVSKHHFVEHPYGNPVIGWRKDIENYKLEDAQNWYKQFYAPQNALVVFAGALGVDEAEWLAEAYYGALKNPEIQPKRPFVKPEPLFTAPKRMTHVDPRTQLPLWVRLYRAPSFHKGVAGAPAPTLKHVAAIALMADVLGGGLTSDLYKTLVIEKKLADSARASYSPNRRFEGEFEITVQPKAGVSVTELEAEVESILTAFLTNPIDQEALERAKIGARSADVFARDDVFEAAYRLGAWRTTGGRYEDYENWLEVLTSVSPEEVLLVGKEVLNLQQSTTAVLYPHKPVEGL